MLIRDLTALKGKTVEIVTASYAGADGVSDKGKVTNVLSGYDNIFIELDSETLVNTRYVRKITVR